MVVAFPIDFLAEEAISAAAAALGIQYCIIYRYIHV